MGLGLTYGLMSQPLLKCNSFHLPLCMSPSLALPGALEKGFLWAGCREFTYLLFFYSQRLTNKQNQLCLYRGVSLLALCSPPQNGRACSRIQVLRWPLFASGLCKHMSCVVPQGGYFSNLGLPGTVHTSPMYPCFDYCHSFFLCNEPGLLVSCWLVLGALGHIITQKCASDLKGLIS